VGYGRASHDPDDIFAAQTRLNGLRILDGFRNLAPIFDQAALKAALDAWFDEVKKARWSSAADVKRSYASASIVSVERIVFNIKGNDYRLVVAFDFEKAIVWIKWLGTHKDYDVSEVEHER
jgi:mRNA interferase HigB